MGLSLPGPLAREKASLGYFGLWPLSFLSCWLLQVQWWVIQGEQTKTNKKNPGELTPCHLLGPETPNPSASFFPSFGAFWDLFYTCCPGLLVVLSRNKNAMEVDSTFLGCLLTFNFLLCLASDWDISWGKTWQYDSSNSLPFHSHCNNWPLKSAQNLPKLCWSSVPSSRLCSSKARILCPVLRTSKCPKG